MKVYNVCSTSKQSERSGLGNIPNGVHKNKIKSVSIAINEYKLHEGLCLFHVMPVHVKSVSSLRMFGFHFCK